MKKLLTLVAILFTTVAMAQHPANHPMGNQFRDFVDFRMQQEKPKVEHKDGKVIITMTEEQFRMMQQRRKHMRAPYRQPMCSCEQPKQETKKHLYYRR